MTCEEVRERMAAFSSGELPRGVRRAVQTHLAECGSCRMALGRVDALAAVLATIRTPPVPPGLASRVVASVRGPRRARPSVSWNPVRSWRAASASGRAAAAAVLLVGLALGLAMGWTSAPSAGRAPGATRHDPLDTYGLDSLAGAPEGSLADTYLSLVSATDEG